MRSNLGRLVKWQDGKGEKGGGWHTGREVVLPPNATCRVGKENVVVGCTFENEDYALGTLVLVQESCTYELSWVPDLKLTEWETREERAKRGEE